MDNYISSGFVRKLSELAKKSSTHLYVPHHLVTSPAKPVKVRIVFDPAAEHEGSRSDMTMLMTSAPVSAAIRENFYVDDPLPNKNDEQSAIHLAREMVDILAQGSFNLTKFTSNSKEVVKTVPSNKLSNQRLNLDLEEPPVERALGIRFCWR